MDGKAKFLKSSDNLHVSYEATKDLINENVVPNLPVTLKWKDLSNQVIASVICALTVVQVGLHMSFSAVLLPQLEVKNSDYNISTTESSWIASLLVLSTPVGSLLSGPIADRYGRKIGNWLTCLPAMTAWLMIAFSPRNTVMWLYIARVLGGLGGGMTTTFIVYVSEISHEKYRAMFLGLNSIAVSLGVLIITANGVFMNWKTMALCYGLFSLITLILICTVVPESPYWLLVFSKKNNCRSDAEKVLKWLNPNKEVSLLRISNNEIVFLYKVWLKSNAQLHVNGRTKQ